MEQTLAAYFGESRRASGHGDGRADSSVLRILRRVLEAVDAIHAAGSAHPPLSPQTIRVDDSDQPHIESCRRADECNDTVAFGSSKYSAPEAFLNTGESSRSCETSDCYVLGLIFYEILIGPRLFRAQFAALENGPPSLWLKWHADKTAKARPLSELVPNLGHFADLIDAMMEKDLSKRITSIPQLIRAFASVEAQTVYQPRRPDTPKRPSKIPRRHLQNKLAFAAAAGLVIGAAVSVFFYRENRPAAVRESTTATSPAKVEAAPNLELAAPDTPDQKQDQNADAAMLRFPQPESELQIESNLNSGALAFIDGQQPVALLPDALFKQKITAGQHSLRFETRSNSSLRLALSVGTGGEVGFVKSTSKRSLRYVLLGWKSGSEKVYGSPDARARLGPGQSYEPVPEEGRPIGNGQAIAVRFTEGPLRELHFDPLPAGSIRIVLEPAGQNLRVPLEISANVPDAAIVVNGETLRHLDKGTSLVRLRPGEYRVKLVHPDYHDSAEQDVVISDGDQQRQLRFELSPVVHQATLAPGSASAQDTVKTADNNTGSQPATQFGKITFRVWPENAQITCRLEHDSKAQDCANNQPCVLQSGAYEVTAKASGFKAAVNHIAIGGGDDKPYDWKLDPAPSALNSSALNPVDVFENGQTWTVDPDGWWTHTRQGYSFLRANRGTFVFDILKPSGLFANKKLSLVVNYKSDVNRVLYTFDETSLRRNERAPGLIADYSVPHAIQAAADYRLTLELSNDRVVIRNAVGQALDNLPLSRAADGKVGFAGKLKLRVIEADYAQSAHAKANAPAN